MKKGPEGPFFERGGGNSGRKAGAATTGAGGVGILDHELGAFEVVLVINFSAHQVLVTHGIDQQRYTILGHGGVVFVGDFVEGEAVLEAGAAATLNKHAQFQVRIAFFGN